MSSEKQILERIARVEELSGKVADMVVGLTREQYAQNELSIEREPLGSDYLRDVNAKLLDSMATIAALNMLVKDHRNTLKATRSDLVDGAKHALKHTVDEYLVGLRRATDEP